MIFDGVQSLVPLEELKMNKLINNRYILKPGSYFADLAKVDFITWRQNEDDGNFWLKLHIGSKEVRFFCDVTVLQSVLEAWSSYCGEEIDLKFYQVGDE